MEGLADLEAKLWQRQTRFDPDWTDRVLHPDFREFGRSGRVYDRAGMIFSAAEAQDISATLHDLQTVPVTDDVALVTYVSEVAYDTGTEWGNRASLWQRSPDGWQLRFHQGTPRPALDAT